MIKKRASGILLHISSLPSSFGIGDLGPAAYQFADFLNKSKQTYWQVLSLNPTEIIYCNSPYSSFSAFASSPLLISPEKLVEAGWLKQQDIPLKVSFSRDQVDYQAVAEFKLKLFDRAYRNFKNSKKGKQDFRKYCLVNASWLEDFAIFVAIKEKFSGQIWNQWPEALRDRDPWTLREFSQKHAEKIEREKFLQYIFFKQWAALKAYCQKKKITIIGDIPIYVNFDSADVWAHQSLFKLNENNEPLYVAGVPPDYFSETGQRWGNPVYDWDRLKGTNYTWWKERFRHNLQLYDIARIDHFRGFVAYWQIPAEDKTAVNGQWVKADAEDFFNNILKDISDLSIIAEDLGVITPDVEKIRDQFNFPGMKVLLFAFSGEVKKHPYIPENYVENCVVYTGTHDNNTAKGWFKHDATKEEKKNLSGYLDKTITSGQIASELITLAMKSKANTVIIPMQDILNLGQEARMNTPATIEGNWEWRLQVKAINNSLIQKLRQLAKNSKRG